MPRLHAGIRGTQGGQHDRGMPRHHDHHQEVQPLHLPAIRLRTGAGGGVRTLARQAGQEVAHCLCRLCLGSVHPRRQQIKKKGGIVVGGTGIPLGTADMTPFLSKIRGNFDGLFAIFFGRDGVAIGNQAFDLGLTRKYKWAGDGGIVESTNLRALGHKIEGFVGINRYLPILDGPLDTPAHRKFIEEASARLRQIDPSGPPPDSFVHSNFEAMNALQLGMQKSGFRGREDTLKQIEALEGLEMTEGDDFPLGEKVLRKEDHQAFNREFIFEMKDGKYKILEVVPKEKTMFPPACKFT